MHATCRIYLILLDLITLTIFGEEHKLLSFSLCSLLQPSAIFSPFGPIILLSTLFSNTLQSILFSQCDKRNVTPIQNNR